jgi:2-hydroxychromene-2-carboxylate isomerase
MTSRFTVPAMRREEGIDAPVLVEFFFSPGSRYSYLAASQMPGLERDGMCRVDWRPLNGGDLRALRGRDPFVGDPVSGQYEWGYRRRDAERWAAFYGIPYREPSTHGLDFRLLARAAMAGKRLGRAAEYGWRLCSSVYASDAWPLDAGVCLDVAAAVGLDRAAFTATLADPETDRLLATAAEEACRRGAFGVPTFFVGDEMFWGNDRIVLLRHHLTRRRR